MNKIRVAAVSYLNARPLLYGLDKVDGLDDKMELIEDFPSKIGQMLIDGKVDVGLVPVAVIPAMKEWHIISDYIIGADGHVASVCLFSEVPIENVEQVFLDFQSRTSVNLCRVLMKYYWKKKVNFIPADEQYISRIKGHTAGVIIGDRALDQLANFPYVYDFGDIWKQMTGQPFVFAAWIANKHLDPVFLQLFNKANAIGLEHLDEIIRLHPYGKYDLQKYFTENIKYIKTDAMTSGLNTFLDYLGQL